MIKSFFSERKFISNRSALFILLMFIVCSGTNAQNEGRFWYFGNKAGLDFSSSPPTSLANGSLITTEGCATISDNLGNLLFYTDGITVYDQLHNVMANGTGLFGNGSSTQSAIIVRQPLSTNIYYIFTQDDVGGINGLSYSIVDMSLAAGMGSVTTKNAFLYGPSCEKIAAARHCNGIDAWVISHDYGTDVFRTYLLTSSGLSMTPVLSNTGYTVTGNTTRTLGQLKVSPQGNKIGLVTYDGTGGPYEICDFNSLTGQVSNALTLGTGVYNYFCEFSPDGSKFYGGRFPGGPILQWDLCAGSSTAIIASCYSITTSGTSLGSLQLAMDGKIYHARNAVTYLSVINNPNLAGAACGYSLNGVNLISGTSAIGLPNFINEYFRELPPPFTFTNTCGTYSFTAPPTSTVATCTNTSAAPLGYLWNFGNASSSSNTSTLTNPVHAFTSAGTFTVKLLINYACHTDTIKQTVTVQSQAANVVVTGAFTVCPGDKKLYTANGATTYSWSTGSTGMTSFLSPTVTTVYTVTGTSGLCVDNKTFTVTVLKCTGLEDLDLYQPKVYPNPAGSILNVNSSTETICWLRNSSGAIALKSKLLAGENSIDLCSIPDGLYSLVFSDGRLRPIKITKITQ